MSGDFVSGDHVRPEPIAVFGRELVVARYREPLDWIPVGLPAIVYSKSTDPTGRPMTPLENIGRESHTYLTHIVSRYDGLAPLTFFCQGDPFPHCSNFDRVLRCRTLPEISSECERVYSRRDRGVPDEFVPLGHEWVLNPRYAWLEIWDDGGRAMRRVWAWLGRTGDVRFPLMIYNGAQFAARADVIRRRSRGEYEDLLDMHRTEPRLPWALELFWPLVFEPSARLL